MVKSRKQLPETPVSQWRKMMFNNDDQDMSEKDSKYTSDEMLTFKAHEAVDALKKILKDCYVNAKDDDVESNFHYALEQLVEVKDSLPDLPKAKETPEERRRRKENEF